MNPRDFGLDFCGSWGTVLEQMIDKDYNHPSVVLYSPGNEIPEIGLVSGWKLNRQIAEEMRRRDPTRYSTFGLNGLLAVADVPEMIEAFQSPQPPPPVQRAATKPTSAPPGWPGNGCNPQPECCRRDKSKIRCPRLWETGGNDFGAVSITGTAEKRRLRQSLFEVSAGRRDLPCGRPFSFCLYFSCARPVGCKGRGALWMRRSGVPVQAEGPKRTGENLWVV